MSTYSWSYKNAQHRQLPVKKLTVEDDDVANTTTSCTTATPSSTTKHINDVYTSNLNKEENTTKPRRLNWKAKLYVGNLNEKTNEASLAYYFRVFGDLADVKLIRDHDTKESRGFAFITFEKPESAEKAKKWCSFNYPTIDDNSITVASAERKVPKRKPLPSRRDPSQTLFWEYKWSNEQDTEVYGPYETSLMLAWKNQGYFDAGCWVRQVHRDCRHITQGKKDERELDCDETPSKKLKLVVDYSDSEDEEQIDGEKNGIVKMEQERKEGIESEGKCGVKKIEVVEEREREEVGENVKVCEGVEERGGEIVEQEKGGEGGENVVVNELVDERGWEGTEEGKERKKDGEGGYWENVKVDEGVGGRELGRKGEGKERKDERVDCEENIKVVEEAEKGELERGGERGGQEVCNMKENGRRRNQEVKEIVENIIGTIVETIKEKEQLLEIYSEHVRTISEDDTVANKRRRDSSSDEEEIIDDTDELSTEFVAISEIDFNFFP